MEFGIIPFDLICRFGELSQNEIRVISYLYACRNQKTGQCNPGRARIIDDTGMCKSNVSKAIAELESKGWLVEDPRGNFVLIEGAKVPFRSASKKKKVSKLPTKSLQVTNQEVGNLLTEVSKLPTESLQVTNTLNKDLNKEGTEKEHTQSAREIPGKGFIPKHSTVIKVSDFFPDPERDRFEEIFFAGLESRRMCSPFDFPKWEKTADYMFRLDRSAETALKSIDFLKTDPSQKWREGRITPEVAANNYGEYLSIQKPVSRADFSKCPDCSGSGMISIDSKTSKICNHARLLQAA